MDNLISRVKKEYLDYECRENVYILQLSDFNHSREIEKDRGEGYRNKSKNNGVAGGRLKLYRIFESIQV